MIFTARITANTIARVWITILGDLAKRKEMRELPVLASSLVTRKTIKVTTTAKPVVEISPRAAIVVTVDTVVTVVIITVTTNIPL